MTCGEKQQPAGGLRSSLLLPLPGCEELDQAGRQRHDQLRNQQELEEEEAVEEALRLRRQHQAVQEVQPHRGQGQAEGRRAPGQALPPGPPVLGHPQAQQGPAVPGQGGEGHRVQADPLAAAAPLQGQRDGPAETEQQQVTRGRFWSTGIPELTDIQTRSTL